MVGVFKGSDKPLGCKERAVRRAPAPRRGCVQGEGWLMGDTVLPSELILLKGWVALPDFKGPSSRAVADAQALQEYSRESMLGCLWSLGCSCSLYVAVF